MNAIQHIDATGLLCPVPLTLLKQALSDKQPGEWVTITVTDVHAELDFQIWCERFGHQLEAVNTHQNQLQFKDTKASSPSSLP